MPRKQKNFKRVKRKDGKITRAERSRRNRAAFRQLEKTEPKRHLGDEEALLAPLPEAAYRGEVGEGRSSFNWIVAERVLNFVSEGGTVKRACALLRARFPRLKIDSSTYRQWVREDRGADNSVDPPRPGLRTLHAQARENQAEAWADDIIAIADDASEEDVQHSRLRVETRKWLMGKNHVRFSEKTTHVLEGGEVPIRTINSEMSDREAALAYAETLKK